MPTGHAMMAMTLDGFVARPDHTLDWLMKQDTEGEDHGFDAFLDAIDVIVMGSGSFRTVLGFDTWVYTKPVIVLSHALTPADIPARLDGKAAISTETPEALMTRLGTEGIKRVYVDGAAVVQSFLSAGLIHDLKVTLVPILIGRGIRLFGDTGCDMDLDLQSVERFPSGLIDTVYRVR